ncbi:MAG: 4Fe-4S dicluster domain-containing protein [Candidatus Thorarchaeota archaeon]|jgi:heterodisulfide reductase subunit C
MAEIKEFDVPSDTVSEFADLIKELHNTDANQCYQCSRCTSGCPLTHHMDYTPAQIMHAIRLGLRDLVLSSNTYWLCLACGTCTARCPRETGLYSIMDALANIAVKEGVKPKDPEIAKFYNIAVKNIRTFGQMYEMGTMLALKLQTGQIIRDVGMGIKMMGKGKLELMPTFQNTAAMKRIFKRVEERENKKKQ